MSPKNQEYYAGGALDSVSRDDNLSSFRKCRIVPRVLRDVSSVRPQTTIFGVQSALPVYIAPASNALLGHPEGELNLTRGVSISCLSGNCMLGEWKCSPGRETARLRASGWKLQARNSLWQRSLLVWAFWSWQLFTGPRFSSERNKLLTRRPAKPASFKAYPMSPHTPSPTFSIKKRLLKKRSAKRWAWCIRSMCVRIGKRPKGWFSRQLMRGVSKFDNYDHSVSSDITSGRSFVVQHIAVHRRSDTQ
jgi:hypothetical protein